MIPLINCLNGEKTMPKTNFDEVMENMTVDQLASYIDRTEYENSCKKCCVYYDKKCDPSMCVDGIKQWLLSEKVS